MFRLMRSACYTIIILVVALGMSVAGLLHGYHRLSAETLIAELSFKQVAPYQYQVALATGDLCQPKWYSLYGDQWRLDAEFLKWKAWANIAGLDGRYRLDRLEGRYSDIDRQNQQQKLSYSLHESSGSTLKDFELMHSVLGMFVDTSYGSSTYQDIDTDRIYQVFKTQSGLINRNKSARMDRDEDGVVIIEINRSCPPVKE